MSGKKTRDQVNQFASTLAPLPKLIREKEARPRRQSVPVKLPAIPIQPTKRAERAQKPAKKLKFMFSGNRERYPTDTVTLDMGKELQKLNAKNAKKNQLG